LPSAVALRRRGIPIIVGFGRPPCIGRPASLSFAALARDIDGGLSIG
jgi:hypothetical protein